MKLGLLLLNVLVVILLSGCGGGSSSSSEKPPLEEKTGVFVDNLVIGMKYVTAQSSGYTNEKGEFPYNGGVVEFYIGNIKIGEITSLPSDGYLFIQDIIGVDRTNIEDERVLKIAKLLQSLDSNKDTDEIELLQGDLEKFNATKKDIQDIDIDTILMQQGFTTISKIDAKRHLNNMLKYYKIIESEDVLVLKDSSITNLETDVSLSPEISLFFSSDVRKNLINKNNILLKDSSDTLIDYEMKHEFDKVIIKPINSLHYSTEYKIIIKRVVEDYGRNSLENEGDNLDKIITFITETEPDTIAPEITLNGSENVFIYLGDEYLEVGAVATDNIDTNLEIKIVGSVDTNTIGKYFVTYSVSDSAGNITTKVRTVEVTPIPDTTAPTFTTADVVSVDENQTQSFIVNAIDDSIVTYKISGIDASYFNIDSSTGEITFKVAPDYETKNQYLISVTARDRSQNRTSQNITININDLDEISPVFTTLNSVSVDENQTQSFIVNAIDDSIVTYKISGTDASYFDIDSSTGEITFKVAPDYETKNQYLITVTATDTSLNFSTQNITININDLDEISPVFTSSNTVSVDENQTSALTVNATDSSTVTYTISGTDASYFDIDSTTGEITFKVAPDYETKNQYLITVTATDTSLNFSTQNITININDLDEISPVFTSSNTVSVDENQTSALTVNATDSSTVTYTISGTDASYFDIDSTTGEITFKVAPDYETKNQYLITVTATDTSLNFSTQNITININDIYEGITVTHNTISYITVKSPITGKIWLDRNLGATQACTKSREEFSSDAEYIADQKSCFGDYYQWGRLSDGHEKETSIVSITQATDIKNAGADFISSSSSYSYDWARDSDQDKSLREIQWAKTDGSSVCPIGFRVPTSQELSDETIYYDGTTDESTGAVKIVNRDTAFKNFLKLPVAGIRINTNGTVSNQGELGSLWSNSNDSVPISQLYFEENSSSNYINSFTSYGFSVRCIEDENLNPTANAGEDKVIFLGTNIEFDAINSSDSDSSISFYEWKEGSTVLSSSQNFSKSDFSLGEHTIILIITDDAGAKDFAKINIKVVPVSVTHNSLTYNLVISPITKRVWLDRNIGATSVCTKSRADFVDSDEYVLDQQSCFGGLYQWGRLTDGHEKRTSSSTSTKATSITNAGTDFIMDIDWLDGYIGGATRTEQWSKTDGTSICPIGFRVPTKTELGEDTITYDGIDDYVTGAVDIKDADTAFKNFLKIPFAGTRNEYSGSIGSSGLSGAVWTAVTAGTWSARAIYIDVSSSGVFSDLQFGRGASVRCILD